MLELISLYMVDLEGWYATGNAAEVVKQLTLLIM